MRPTTIAFTLITAVSLVGCGTESGSDGTFACNAPDGGVGAQCTYNSQYCEVVTQGGSTTATCRSVPSSCAGAGSPCTCIQATITGAMNQSCFSIAIASSRQTTVQYSR